MEYYIGHSHNNDINMCVKEATGKLKKPSLILFFSPVENFDEYARVLHEQFPESVTMGATSIAAFSNRGAEKNGLHLIGFESGIKCSANMLEHIDKYPIKYVSRVKKCVDEIKDTQHTICLEFTTAFLCSEESVLGALNSVLDDKKIPVFGGTAGDDASGRTSVTKVALNGVVKDNACVFTLMHSESGKIHIFRENIYKPITGNILTVTKADSSQRKVMEYNNEPATKVFARELGVDERQIEKYLDTNPMGRIVGDEMYVTANCMRSGTGMIYHARIYNNSKVVALKPADYRETIKETKKKIKDEVPHPKFAIMCHCLARTLLFEGNGYLQEYAKDMGSVLGNYIGFSGYGEQKGEEHFNQTMAVAVFE